MGFNESLDRYLTTPPSDDFDNWCEDVLGDKISDSFYNENEKWIDEYDGQCNKWLNELFKRGIDSVKSALIIERAYKIYIK